MSAIKSKLNWVAAVCCCFGAIVLVATSGCSPKQSSLPHVETETGITPPSSPIVSVSDRLERTVQFPTVPKRVVSLSPATTELIYAIGAGTQLVGATKYCNYPSEANDIPRVGAGTLESISRETIVSLNPDLVLCKWDTHEPLVESLESLGIPTLAVGADSLEQLFDEITLLGSVMGTTTQAESLVDSMRARLAKLSAVTDSIPEGDRVSVFYEVWHEPLMTAGPESFIGELLKIAGLKNIFHDTNQRYPKVSSEVVVHRNPDVILAPSTHATEVNIDDVMARPGWEGIRAVRDKKIFLIDGDQVSRCGPRLLEALEQMIRAVYPERLRLDDDRSNEGKPVEP